MDKVLVCCPHLAQEAGFTVAEIQILFNGFAADTPPAERSEALARRKLDEVDVLIQRAQRMTEPEPLIGCPFPCKESATDV